MNSPGDWPDIISYADYLHVFVRRPMRVPAAANGTGCGWAGVVGRAPLAIVLGERDMDVGHKHLNTSDHAAEQGPHRLARGHHFYQVVLRGYAHPSVAR